MMIKLFAFALLVSSAAALPWCDAPCAPLCLTEATVSTQASDCTAFYSYGDGDNACDATSCPFSDGTVAQNITLRAANLCHEPVDNLVTSNPPTLNPIDAGGDASVDFTTRFHANFLKISWQEPVQYHFTNSVTDAAGRAVRYNFGGALDDTACMAVWDDDAITVDSVIDGRVNTTDRAGCYTDREIRAVFGDLYNFVDNAEVTNPCGGVRDETNPDYVAVTFDFQVNYEEQQARTRTGNPVSRALTFRLPVEVRFPRQINVTTADIRVFSPVNYIAAITQQRMFFVNGDSTDINNARLNVTLYTDVQWPFSTQRFATGTGVTSRPLHVAVESDATRQEVANCVSGGVDTPASCDYNWDMTFFINDTAECDFNGRYTVTLETVCMDGIATADCPIATADVDNFDTAIFNFDIVTSRICPEVVENIEVTASAKTYLAECVTPGVSCTEKVGFLHGQTVFLTAEVVSQEASIEATIFRRCDLVRTDGGLQTLQIYDRTWTPTDAYYVFRANEGGPAGFGQLSYPRFSMFVNTADAIVGDGAITPVIFSDGTDGGLTGENNDPESIGQGPASNIMQLGADENASIRIECIIDVLFANTNTRSSRNVVFELNKDSSSSVSLFEESAGVQTNFAFGGPTSGVGVVTPPPAAGTGGAALSTTTIVYAAIGAVGAISIFTLAIVLSRRNNKNDSELTASSSQANLVDHSVSESGSTGGVVQGVTVYV